MASGLASDLSRTQMAGPVDALARGIGDRLRHIRASRNQPEMAEHLMVSARTYGHWERSERTPDAHALVQLCVDGWNGHWLLTGEGPERLEAAVQSQSQDLSEANLNIALEFTDDIIRATRATYVPRALYARLLRLMYMGVTQGLPVAEIHDIGQQLVRAVISGTGEEGNGGQSGLDDPSSGRR